MDRGLVLKLLGKKHAVDLEDQVYNLRDITDGLREKIILGLQLEEDYSLSTINRLKTISKILLPIKDALEDENIIPGYTNSKLYLKKFINDIILNIDGIIEALNPFDNKNFIYHTNVLMDKILAY